MEQEWAAYSFDYPLINYFAKNLRETTEFEFLYFTSSLKKYGKYILSKYSRDNKIAHIFNDKGNYLLLLPGVLSDRVR